MCAQRWIDIGLEQGTSYVHVQTQTLYSAIVTVAGAYHPAIRRRRVETRTRYTRITSSHRPAAVKVPPPTATSALE